MNKIVMVHYQNDICAREETSKGVGYEKLTPEIMADYFSTWFLNFDTTTIMWIKDLRLYAESIIDVLYKMGWMDVTSENPTIKQMPSRSFKYVIELRGNAYAIFIRRSRHTFYIYNSDNMLSNLLDNEIIETFGENKKKTLKNLADSIYNGITSLRGFQSMKTPFTLSMVAMREWKNIEDLYFCQNLTDCKKYWSPDGRTLLSEYLRKSYNGGWNYLNGKISREEYSKKGGFVYDVNSLYSFIMASKPLPWGSPVNFYREIPEDIRNNSGYYYFVRIIATFDLKEGNHFPYIQKRGDFRYRLMDYLDSSDIIRYGKDGKIERSKYYIGLDGKKKPVRVELTLTKTDYELFHRHYDVHNEVVIDGVYYRVSRSAFKHYVKYYYNIKSETKDPGKKRISKMLLNGLSGTLAKRDKRTNLIYQEQGATIEPKPVTTFNPSPSYIHMASALLSYAREYTYEAACANYDHFLYSDTDSLHLYDRDYIPVGIKIDPKELGAWKKETEFIDAYYMKRKSYVMELPCKEEGFTSDRFKITMSGVAYSYKKFIEDALNGYDISMLWKAESGEYGDASWIFRKTLQYKQKGWQWDDMTEEEDFTVDFYKHFTKMSSEIENTPEDQKIGILQYIEYPTGINTCKDFKISHMTMWERMQKMTAVDKMRIKGL